MDNLKTRSLRNIEEKMQGLDQSSLRYQILENAKNFKTSWIGLAQALYSVWKDKLYKEWGYVNFEKYTSAEMGIRKQTAMKLLKSYYFLEKEEPHYLQKDFLHSMEAANVPSYETVDALRLAKNKKILDEEDYVKLRKDVFEKGKDARSVKQDLTTLIRQRQELEPEEAWQKRKMATLRRFLGVLKSLRQEAEVAKLLPASVITEANNLIGKLEAELS